MLLVTGGYRGKELTSSTEVYRPSAGEWREVPGGALPRPMIEVHVVTLNNRVLLFGEKIILICCSLIARTYVGGRDKNMNDYAEILEYSELEGEERWIIVGKMKKRAIHGVSIIDFDNFKDYCL